MYIFQEVSDLQFHLQKLKKQGKRIAFVPTMGALHEGHLSLIQNANEKAAITVASIFVNPTQFDVAEDLDNYPRTVENDIKLLVNENTDVLFLPSVDEIYPGGTEPISHFDFGGITKTMEGAHRDGHFDGVAQVVNRLLEIVQPNFIVMGQKDFQQTCVIQRLLELTNSATSLVVAPTIREDDGLAMSSRNVRLTPEERAEAPIIYATLRNIKLQYNIGSIANLKEQAIASIEASANMKVDYLEFANAANLQPIQKWEEADKVVIATGVHLGKVRLIDNVLIGFD